MNTPHPSPWVLRDPDGTPFRGVGLNVCWESRDRDDSAHFGALHEDPRFSYDVLFPRLAELGVNFVRVWMVYWNLPVDGPRTANNRRYVDSPASERFNASGIAALRGLLALAERTNIRLMLCLETHVGFLGEGWALSPYNQVNGGPASTPREFFALPEARSLYREKLALVAGLVGRSPAVSCWEFFNEIDNLTFDAQFGGPPDDPVVVEWHREMAQELRRIDPLKRPVTTSISHREIPGLWTDSGLDLNQHHIYCRTDAIPHELEAQLERTGTPHVIGEFGHHWDWSLDFRTLEPAFSRDFRLGLWLGLFSPTPILPLSWWWEYFEDKGSWEAFRTVAAVNRAQLEAGAGDYRRLPGNTGPASSVPGWTVHSLITGRTLWFLALRRVQEPGTPSTAPAPDPGAHLWPTGDPDILCWSWEAPMTEPDVIPEFDTFSSAHALSLGQIFLGLAQTEFRKPIAFSIALDEHPLLVHFMDGVGADKQYWITVKQNVVKSFGVSSYAVHLAYAGKSPSFLEATGLPEADYRAEGGSVPLVVAGKRVGTVTVSGMDGDQDHALAINGLRQLASRH